jgi:aspartate aminotransferase
MFSEKVIKNLNKSSFIRAMFEEGEKLRKLHGTDNVFDFSLGNPETEPPVEVKNTLKQLVSSKTQGMHRYMSNAGYWETREKIASSLTKETGLLFTGKNIVMTCGAAAGLNVVFKTLLNPGDEVIVFSPYFVEYLFYIDNHGGIPVIAPTDKNTFMPDVSLLEKYITPRTRAVLINSPNNPTGVIYDKNSLKEISDTLLLKGKKYGTTIFIISDDPYTKIVYDNAIVPDVLSIYQNSISVTSFSKSLALPGERIGYIAVNPAVENVDIFTDGLIFCNRTLGFVNAPALFQKTVENCLDTKVDINDYKKKRDLLYNHLISLGYSCIKPQGAFYLFPKSLIADDVEFAKTALKYNILLVPGQGFGWPGHFRLAYCINIKTIEKSLPAFEKLTKGIAAIN